MSSLFSHLSAMILVLTCAGVTACSAGDRANGTLPGPALDAPMASTRSQQTAVIAGGCFWGIQAVFQHTKGVISAISGYSGGSAKTAEYELVSTGETGHTYSTMVPNLRVCAIA
jgi:peptide-methionine (S)-S-oxide reductase